ncbi:cupin-like domain-containing protein [Pelagibacterium xiamenense]|uniref:cupin-like domain-containing protein n=1 Tax=Pelagibacterium xiamenense TaxID=2901140 RepID=UPI001E457108|nr:cupin-like domain-containing protein [Pelagibacterium xiamenense]MCD7058382.1 cupin-like domain-containing protein [Pelagibacterium xiamenense]
MTELLRAERSAFETLFPNKPFRITHGLENDPRLTLDAILDLVKSLPGDRIEYNSGKAAVSQDPDATPLVDLSPEEIVKRVETAGAWMVLKQVETHPDYKALLEDALLSVARAQGFSSLRAAGFSDIQGFVFVSSPNSTTPFHLDSEDNFFVQIHGDKQFNIYDNDDRSIANEDQIEHCITKHRNLKFEERYEAKGMHNDLKPGEGVFVPYLWPHYIKTRETYSISVAITWKTRAVRRRNRLYVANAMLRDRGFAQKAPGVNPGWDALKVAFIATGAAIAAPLRKSEGLRKMIRSMVLGKNANYYYRAQKKDAGAHKAA